jgi:DNA-binding protein YbaB
MDYSVLLKYAKTNTQIRVMQHLSNIQNELGFTAKNSDIINRATEELNMEFSGIYKHIRKMQAYAAQSGEAETRGATGYTVKGESVLVDGQGNVKQKWIKTEVDKEEKLRLFQEAITGAFEDYKGKSIKVKKNPLIFNDDLLVFIPIGDAHIGMRAWEEEVGQNFDLDIVERDLLTAMYRLIDAAPAAKTCFIGEMGDYLHYESNAYATPQSGHVLDADSRYIKMCRVGVKILIHSIQYALTKFDKVVLRNVIGNHAPHGEQMLALALDLYYHNNDRVIVETSASKNFYYQFGDVLIGLTHGDGVKHANLPLLMANDVPEMWGTSKHRYIYIGHVHHKDVKEHPGCIIESFNTLAAQDAWHRKSGYRAKQNISLIVHHKKYGEIERITKDISMIRAEHE